MKKNKNRKFVSTINKYINEARNVSSMNLDLESGRLVTDFGSRGIFIRAWKMCIPDDDAGNHTLANYKYAFDAEEWPEMFDVTKDGYFKWWDLLKKTRETAWSGLKIEEFEYDKVKYGPGDAMTVYYKFIEAEIRKSAQSDASTNQKYFGSVQEILEGTILPYPDEKSID